jgi:uncharacterized protein
VAVSYEWDDAKRVENTKKHGLEFADAIGVFEDGEAITVPDEKSGVEDRFITIGRDFLGRIVVVVYTWRGENIRIISARKATRRQREQYED